MNKINYFTQLMALILARMQATSRATNPDRCPFLQEMVECANPCAPTCADPTYRVCPTFACMPACECRKGFVRKGNYCVLPKECWDKMSFCRNIGFAIFSPTFQPNTNIFHKTLLIFLLNFWQNTDFFLLKSI